MNRVVLPLPPVEVDIEDGRIVAGYLYASERDRQEGRPFHVFGVGGNRDVHDLLLRRLRSYRGPDPLADILPKVPGGERAHEASNDAHARHDAGLL